MFIHNRMNHTCIYFLAAKISLLGHVPPRRGWWAPPCMIWNESTALQLNDWATESMWLSKAQRLTLHICTPIHRWCGSVQTVVESSRSFSSCARGPFSAVLPPVRTSPAWLCVGRQLRRHRSLGSTAYQQHHTAHRDLGKCRLLKTKHNKRKQTIYNIFKLHKADVMDCCKWRKPITDVV